MKKIKKRLLLSAFTSVALVIISAINVAAQAKLSGDQVLQKVADKLASAKTLRYTYKRELNYASENYLNTTTGDSFLDLQPADSPTGFKYQFSNDATLEIYNGSERFIANKEKKTVIVANDPPLKVFANSSFLYYSPVTLKNALPKIVADKAVEKKVSVTAIDGAEHYVIEFSLDKAAIDSVGEIYQLRSERKSVFRLTVNKKTLLPVEVLVGNDQNQDFAKMSFTGIREGGPVPSELSWYYSTYSSEYRLEKPVDLVLIQGGKAAPEFDLIGFGSSSHFSLGQYKGKVVLLEFWIANCGFCIGAVPKLNALAEGFRGKDFELVSINIHDSTKTIDIFKNNNKPAYPILTGTEATAAAYGVSAFPTFVLIDRDGKVVYSMAGLDDKALQTAITNNL